MKAKQKNGSGDNAPDQNAIESGKTARQYLAMARGASHLDEEAALDLAVRKIRAMRRA